MSENLVLQFDPNTIDHLGISLYSKLPTVISELISNAWDADADNVRLNFKDATERREIVFSDDGDGMSFQELNEKYLIIGRNRRDFEEEPQTPKGRKVIGKKGLGKLSAFGICKIIEVETVKNGIKNSFRMSIEEIKKAKDKSYFPEILERDVSTSEPSGTKIWLRDIRRKTPFNPTDIAKSLSKKFLIFDQIDARIQHNSSGEFKITNEMKFEGFNNEFEWEFPNTSFVEGYKSADEVRGKIFTLATPVKDTEMRGIYLTSRGKIVNTAEFYGLRDNDNFHTYVTGDLEIDFIDDISDDLISTDRQSLNWEHEVTSDLKDYLQEVIKKISGEWRKKRAEKKRKEIAKSGHIDIDDWQGKLPVLEKELSARIIDPVLENASIDVAESEEIISGVIDKFDNRTYQDYASQIAASSQPDDIPRLLRLMDDWKMIESRQYSDLAQARIEVINQFEEYLSTDTKEVPTLHNFLKKFSWLLDPRILEFRDEVHYSKLLKENFPEAKLEEADRRIDFLCSNALGGILYVIEIKRSKYKIDVKALDQAYEYGGFLDERYASQSGFSKVVCYVVGGEKSTSGIFKRKENTYRDSGEVFVKTYAELLEQSKEYHREFIDLYNSSN